MSRSLLVANLGRPLMLPLRELYLSIFVLFFRISRWRGDMKARAAAGLLSIIEGSLVASLVMWSEVGMGQHVPMKRWVGGIGFVILYLLNDHFLVDRGRGTAFEQQFRSFRATKQTILYVAAI